MELADRTFKRFGRVKTGKADNASARIQTGLCSNEDCRHAAEW
jgi:hypothetical protein